MTCSEKTHTPARHLRHVKIVRRKGREYRYLRVPGKPSVALPGEIDIESDEFQRAHRDAYAAVAAGLDWRDPSKRTLEAERADLLVYLCAKARHRAAARGLPFDLTPDHLEEVYAGQGGCCPITGWRLEMRFSPYAKRDKRPASPSVDRVDPALGYVSGNVRLLSLMANVARLHWGDDLLVRFCRAVVKENPRKIGRPRRDE